MLLSADPFCATQAPTPYRPPYRQIPLNNHTLHPLPCLACHSSIRTPSSAMPLFTSKTNQQTTGDFTYNPAGADQSDTSIKNNLNAKAGNTPPKDWVIAGGGTSRMRCTEEE